jgi:hypothetical protein
MPQQKKMYLDTKSNICERSVTYIRVLYIVACRPLLGNYRKQTRLHSNESTRRNKGILQNGVFCGRPCQGIVGYVPDGKDVSGVLKPVTRKRLVKTEKTLCVLMFE